jgi:hypothetical protein
MKQFKDFLRNFTFWIKRYTYQQPVSKNTRLLLIPVSRQDNDVMKQ